MKKTFDSIWKLELFERIRRGKTLTAFENEEKKVLTALENEKLLTAFEDEIILTAFEDEKLLAAFEDENYWQYWKMNFFGQH